MNSLIGIPLRNLWGLINKGINKFKYIGLPLMYLLVILLVVPDTQIIVNELKPKQFDSFTTIISKEDKIEIILKKYDLTMDEFNIIRAIVLSEAETNSYEDAYAVINTIYNRAHSKNWVRSVSNRFGKDKGKNLYYQAIAPNQFTVYQSGSYKRNLNNTKSKGNDAIIDFLYEEKIMHNYLSFRSHSIKVNNSESFSNKGNNYFNLLKESNRI